MNLVDSQQHPPALPARIAAARQDVAVALDGLLVDAGDLEMLSEQMHREHHRCGGFAVHESVIDAYLAQTAAKPRKIEYSIDRPEVVQEILPALSEANILGTITELLSMKNRYYRSASGAAR